MSELAPPRRRAHWLPIGLAVATAAVALAFDPLALAAQPKRALLLLLALGAVVSLLLRAPRAARASTSDRWVAACACAFVALSALSLFYGNAAGRLDLATWLGALGLSLFVARMQPPSAVFAARLSAVFVGGCSGALAVVAALSGARGLSLHAGQGNPNWLGLLLAACVPLSIDFCMACLRDPKSNRRDRWLSLGCLGVVVLEIAGLALAESRVAWVALAAVGAIRAFAHVAHLARRPRALVMLAGVALMLLVLVAAFELSGAGPLEQPLRALGGRAAIARHALAAAHVAAPWGVGLGRFGHAFLDAQGAELQLLPSAQAARQFVNATTAHNDFLQAAVESGPLAAIALLLAFLLGARSLVHGRLPAAGATVAVVAFCALGDSPLRMPALVAFLAVVVGAQHARRAPRTSASSPTTWRRHLSGAAYVAVALGIALSLPVVVRDWLGTRVRSTAAELAPEARLLRLRHACALDPDSGEAWLELGLFELVLGERLALTHLERSQPLLANAGTAIALGQAALAAQEPARAESEFRAALRWQPGSIRARAGLAEALLALKDYAGAEAAAKAAQSLAPADTRLRALSERISKARLDDGG